jgi:hypothetical protein
MAARTSKIQQAACERVLRDGMGGERGRSTAGRTASEAGTGGAGERGLRGRGRRAGPVHGQVSMHDGQVYLASANISCVQWMIQHFSIKGFCPNFITKATKLQGSNNTNKEKNNARRFSNA